MTGPSNILGFFTNIKKYQVTATTTNATTTNIFSLVTINNTNYTVFVQGTAYCTTGSANGNGASFTHGNRITNNSGSVSISMDIDNHTSVPSVLSEISLIINTSETNIVIQVTGLTSQTIDWCACVRIINVS